MKNNPREIQKKSSIRRDLTLGLVVTIMSVLLGVGSLSYFFIINQAEQDLAQQTADTVQRLKGVLGAPLWNFDQNLTREVVDAYAEAENIVAIRVFDDKGELVYEAGQSSDTDLPPETSPISYEDTPVGQLEVFITRQNVVEQQRNILFLTLMILVFVVGAVIAVNQILLNRFLSRPLLQLTEGLNRIAGGNYTYVLPPVRQVEIDSIGQQVTVMAGQIAERDQKLREMIDSLEERVAARTQRLEMAASLGGQLNAILNFDHLLNELVTQVKERFDYYHVHVYLLDETAQKLVMKAGYGQVGERMKAQNHAIPLNASASLVARAARTQQVVLVDNVKDDSTWLPNPLLPATQAELAVPMITEGRVMGVLDVQSDQVSGLDEGDANLLRSLASQVAVSLTNIRLIEQAQQRAAELAAAKESAETASRVAVATNEALEKQVWQTTGQAQLNNKMRGEQDIPTLANNVVQHLCHYLNAQIGALYMLQGDTLRLVGSYAYNKRKGISNEFKLGEMLIGQAALEKQIITVTALPEDYLAIGSGLGQTVPRNITLAPFLYEGRVIGVIELGTVYEFTPVQVDFLQTALENIAIAFNTAETRTRINELLAETRKQAEELQDQEEELRAANEELESQTESLRASEAKLKTKQVELEEVNSELEEKAEALQKNSAVLQEQRAALDRQNRELKVAQQELEQKAAELALASKYKSEFLANMSHELRTPLNSLLILAGMLAKNEDGNLTSEQVESAQIIYSGGSDLLHLINEILDLSKVEAGRMDFHFAPVSLERLISTMRAQFTPIAEGKNLTFETSLAENLPETIETDQQRVEQIVKNLLSNAFKFTSKGSVRLTISRPQPDIDLSKSGLNPARAIAISVSDSGIGMTPEQQKIVFEAFQQADGSTSRQYGGTGLGLTISRELAVKLGGQIHLVSEKGQGSAFTLYLPVDRLPKAPAVKPQPAKFRQNNEPKARAKDTPVPPGATHEFDDDRNNLQAGDRILLIIEDDAKFAKVVTDCAHKKRFKCLLAGDGETGLQMAQTYPVDAIILDLNLPDISGWEVLDVLKDNSNTRHIPVHIMSVMDADLDAYKRGALGFLSKPVSQAGLEESFQQIEEFISRKIKSLLLVEDDANLRKSVRKLLEGNDVIITEASLGQTALEQLAGQHFDCMILDLSLPDMNGFELLNRLDGNEGLSKCPVIVYTGKALTEEENRELLKYADSVIVKGVKSPERLLDETALFLHRVIANLPEEKQQAIKRLHDSEAVLAGKSILIVDDDARNAFALSRLLAGKELSVYIAPTGQKALELLDKKSIDLVLMDIMMPGMDGYETTRQIRTQPKFHRLPVLALTAKAMKGDREKCIAAGANDYLSKPVDPDRLFSMLRVWLSRE